MCSTVSNPPPLLLDLEFQYWFIKHSSSSNAILFLFTPAIPPPDFSSIHFNKNIEDYLLKLMCCAAYLPWQQNKMKTFDEKRNLHHKTHEFYPSSK